MPRTKVGIPWEQQELEAELRERYKGKGYMSLRDIATELGVSIPTVRKWAEGMDRFKIGREHKYRVRDVAKRIYESKEE